MASGVDILTVLTEEGSDWQIEDGDLSFDRSPATLALITAFTDARRDSDGDLAPDPRSSDRRGYWADLPGERWGSLWWLMQAATLTPRDVGRGQTYLEDAFRWWIEEDLAESVEVTVERVGTGADSQLHARVTIRRGSARAWPELWERLEGGLFRPPQPGLALTLLVN